MSRIRDEDGDNEIVNKLSDEFSFVKTICNHFKKGRYEKIDPDSDVGWRGLMTSFDDNEIYGIDIENLFRKCNSNTTKMVCILRAVQLKIYPSGKLREFAYDRKGRLTIHADEWHDLRASVLVHCPNFRQNW